jgi:tRNA A37 methylthiotransferase MiaB
MDQSVELEIYFYCECAICNGHYHDFSNSYESNAANLEIMENEIEDDNLQEMRRRIFDESVRKWVGSSVFAVVEGDQYHKKQYSKGYPLNYKEDQEHKEALTKGGSI